MPIDTHGRLVLRVPEPTDARHIWQLAGDSGVLEQNSGYAYALLCEHFSDTCVVADDAGALAGFVVGYRLPKATDTMFVWQVTVDSAHRGQGLAAGLILDLLSRPTLRDVQYLEATVTPSNEASRRLFGSVARQLGTTCEVLPFLSSDLLPESGREDEYLYRIGPFSAGSIPAS